LEDLSRWLNCNGTAMFYVRLVKIPADAQIWVETDKFKADRLILEDRQRIADLEVWEDSSYCLTAVQNNGYALQYVKEQTPEICLAAVQNNGYALQYVKDVREQTPEICLAAVQKDGSALQYVKKQTP